MERIRVSSEHENEKRNGLNKYPGLRDLLDFSNNLENKNGVVRFSRDEVVKILAKDSDARRAAIDLLSRNAEEAEGGISKLMLDDLAWAIVDELASRLGQR